MKHLINLVTSSGLKEEAFMDFAQNLSSLISYGDNPVDVDSYKKVFEILEDYGYNLDKTMEELAQPCSSMVKKCSWRSVDVPCSQIMQKIKTSNGYCCSFNYYAKPTADAGIRDPDNLNNTYMGLVGSNHGLQLILDVEPEQYVSPIRPSYGFNVLVQNGGDYPDMLTTAKMLGIGEEMKVSVTPNIYVSSNKVRDMKPNQRQCLFEDEMLTKWSPIYSYKTCLVQCRARAIFNLCGCIPFYYSIKSRKRVCTPIDETCFKSNNHRSTSKLVDKNMVTDIKTEATKSSNTVKKNTLARNDNIQCLCYPQCNENVIDTLASKVAITSSDGRKDTNSSILKVFYNRFNCIKTQRDVYYTWYRILAAVGGIFSLCLGASIISIVECVYIFGKCIYKFNNIESNSKVVMQSSVTRINVKARSERVNKSNNKSIKASMFHNAFGKH